MSYATLNGVICAGTLPIQSNSNVISIEVEPDRNPVVTVNFSSVCFEDVSELVFTLSIDDEAVGTDTFMWYNGSTIIPGAITKIYKPTLDTDIVDGDVISAQVSTGVSIGGAAIDQCAFTSAPVAITIDDAPTASLTSNKLATSHTVCEFESITFTATNTTLVGAAGTVTYTFTSDSAGELYRGPNNTHTTSFTLDTVVTVTIESNSGCTDSAALTVLVPKMTAAGTISASNADLLLCGSVASPAALSADVSGTSSNCNGCRCSCNISVADQKHRSCNLG